MIPTIDEAECLDEEHYPFIELAKKNIKPLIIFDEAVPVDREIWEVLTKEFIEEQSKLPENERCIWISPGCPVEPYRSEREKTNE